MVEPSTGGQCLTMTFPRSGGYIDLRWFDSLKSIDAPYMVEAHNLRDTVRIFLGLCK